MKSLHPPIRRAMPPEKQPVPLLGRLAVHLKMISMEQLTEALRVQGQAAGERSLGVVLRDLGYLTPAQIEKLVEAQKRVVAQQQQKAAPPEPAASPAPKAAAPPARPEGVKPAQPTAARASAPG